MPKVRRSKRGFVILSRWHGRNMTHQVTPDGQELLRAQGLLQDGQEISVDVLMDLKKSRDAYTNRQRRRWRRTDEDDTLFAESTSPVSSAAPPLVLPTVATVPCPRCRRQIVSGAAYCNQCGAAIAPAGARPNVLGWLICLLLLVIIGLLWYAVAR